MFKIYSVFTGELFEGGVDFVDACDLAIEMEKSKGGGFTVFQEIWDTSQINEKQEAEIHEEAVAA